MALSDAQIDRYSRQIILPEVGGAGQQRLLAAAWTIIGNGALAATAARYLAGAGIGALTLVGGDAEALAHELALLNPDVAVAIAPAPAAEPGRSGGSPRRIAADLGPAALDALARAYPCDVLIAAGTTAVGGWLHVAAETRGCAGCAMRTAAAIQFAGPATPSPIAAGVLGAVVALEAIKHSLGLASIDGDAWSSFDASAVQLESHRLSRAADCGACAPIA
ncbi:MAG: ThiF family adenylyltransferase [bacterium]